MYKLAAKEMCDEITKIFPLSSKVVAALCAVDREKFIPAGFAPYLAYDINPLPMTESQYISSPLTVAQMTEYLAPMVGIRCWRLAVGAAIRQWCFPISFAVYLVLSALTNF